MKTVSIILTVAVVLMFAGANGFAQDKETNWDAFSKNLVKGIESGNDGVQQAAMRHIILYNQLYPGKLDVNDAVWEIMKIFRSHKNPQVRRLAMVALFSIGNEKAIFILKRNVKFEEDKEIKKQSYTLVQTFYAQKEEKKKKKDEALLATKDE